MSLDNKSYDTKGMLAALRRIGLSPRVEQNTSRPSGSATDGRIARHEGYAESIDDAAVSRRSLTGANSGAACVSSSCAATTMRAQSSACT